MSKYLIFREQSIFIICPQIYELDYMMTTFNVQCLNSCTDIGLANIFL